MVIFSTASFILDSIPQVSWLHPFLITHNWLAFGDLFRDAHRLAAASSTACSSRPPTPWCSGSLPGRGSRNKDVTS